MLLEQSTWMEVDAYLEQSRGIIIPTGSTEQHGPIGLIGTDAICARDIATDVGAAIDALVAPVLAYTPAPFNMKFPGTISISEDLFESLANEIVTALALHGFSKFYFLNGHGANLDPLERLVAEKANLEFRIKSWWDFETVNDLRIQYYGDWEGMHGTPSEVAITRVGHRTIESEIANDPPEKLSKEFLKAHARDKHGSADDHKKAFPDGRVGSHSALATSVQGQELLKAAVKAISADYLGFMEK